MKATGVYLGREIWGRSSENEALLAKAFRWVARIGAAPAFGSRPIGWYQQHAVRAIEIINVLATRVAAHPEGYYKVQNGTIRFRTTEGSGGWLDTKTTPREVYDAADRSLRGGR